MIDKNQVQSHYVDECNCIHDRKDASRNELLHVLEVVKLIQLWEYTVSCKMLWCWIGLSDAWAAVFFLWDQTAWMKPFLPQHEQRRASATSHCNLNWSLGKHHIVAHRLDNQWEIAVICFAPATIVLMREFRTRKRETSELRGSHTERAAPRRAAPRLEQPEVSHTVRHTRCAQFILIHYLKCVVTVVSWWIQ